MPLVDGLSWQTCGVSNAYHLSIPTLHHDSGVTWTGASCPRHLIEMKPTERALQPQGPSLKTLVSVNVVACPHGISDVAKNLTHGAELCVHLPQELKGMLSLRKQLEDSGFCATG